MMLLLLLSSFGETGLSGLGAVFLRSPPAAQNNFDLCPIFSAWFDSRCHFNKLGFMVALERVFIETTHCGKHSPLCSIVMKPYLMYSGLYFRFDTAKTFFANLLINKFYAIAT